MGIFIKNNCDCCPPSVCEPCETDPCAATSGTGGSGTLYYKDGGSKAWEDVSNWWQDSAATIPALGAPWIQPCFAYRNYNLTLATDQPADTWTVNITGSWEYGYSYTEVSGFGTCDIPYIFTGWCHISDGTFTGDNFENDSVISGGTFSGSNFVNMHYIDGGLFLNSGFTNAIVPPDINFNWLGGHIVGGTWAGSGFVNDDGSGNAGYVCAPSWPIQTC